MPTLLLRVRVEFFSRREGEVKWDTAGVGEALIKDERLEWIVRGLDSTGWAAEVCDADWRLVWVSAQTRALIGDPDESDLGLGEHILESRRRPAWQRMVSDEAQEEWVRQNVPQMLADDPDGAERLAAIGRPELRRAVEECEPAEIPIWTWLTRTTGVEPAVREVRNFGLRVRTADGEPFATVYMYGANLPATLLALVAQGDRGMFERMARLTDPGRREASILFADIEASGDLSRHLSSAAYFRLVHELFTKLDGVVIDADGIVGKHAGDGMSAYFLTDDCGSKEEATGAAIDAAIKLTQAARDTGDGVTLNVGVHWGGALYMGQVVTGGRLEVTALGDEVNECARIQESARGGVVLASKPLIERLDPAHARDLGIDPDTASYTTVAELPDVSEKAVRDAGSIPVTEVRCER
jgi:class 3 adenylate cyclase